MESVSCTFNLFQYINFDDVNEHCYISMRNSDLYLNTKTFNNGMTIIKYNKDILKTNDNKFPYGLFRSVVLNKNNHIIGFSPVKSQPLHYLKDLYNYNINSEQIKFEEFVEGTMINVFYDNISNNWELSTRSVVGGKTKFFTSSNMNFREMFLDAMNTLGLSFDELNKKYSYSFVLQHPEHQFIKQINTPKLYLCALFKCNGERVKQLDFRTMGTLKNKVFYPDILSEFHSIDDVEEAMSSGKYDFTFQGVVIRIGNFRTKVRNVNYNNAALIRGNQPKMLYRFIELTKTNEVNTFVKYFPRYKDIIESYKTIFNLMIKTLHSCVNNYCIVEFMRNIEEYPYEFRPHTIALFEMHKAIKKRNTFTVSVEEVEQYISLLPCQRIMFIINYNHKYT